MSPLLDFDCPLCGTNERFYRGEPPEDCPDCGTRHTKLYTRMNLGGEIAWMKGKELDAIELQLGVRPESPEHLRAVEKRLGVQRLDKKELHRMPDGPSEAQQEKKLAEGVRWALDQGRKAAAQ